MLRLNLASRLSGRIIANKTIRHSSSSPVPPPSDLHAYTTELYKKNYIKYTVQSQQTITHDYVYTGDERLPTLEQRLAEFKNPLDELRRDIGRKITSVEKELGAVVKARVQANKANKEMEVDAKELRCKIK
jgi:hypothetical protein